MRRAFARASLACLLLAPTLLLSGRLGPTTFPFSFGKYFSIVFVFGAVLNVLDEFMFLYLMSRKNQIRDTSLTPCLDGEYEEGRGVEGNRFLN